MPAHMELRAGSERPAADLGPELGGSARDCSETSWKRLPMDSVDVKRAEATDLQTGDLDNSRPALVDPFGREISYLRVSVTDRCDFRCVYCMAEHMSFLPKADLLTLEELDRLCSAFIGRGVRKLRLTGGEPLVRRGIMTLFATLSRHLASGRLDELTLTTNGSQLAKYAAELAAHGVRRVNVSLDTLDPDKFRAITRWGALDQRDRRDRCGAECRPENQDQRGCAQGRERGRDPRSRRMGARPRHGFDADRGDAARRNRRRPARPISAALARPRAAFRTLLARRARLPHRRAGALCARRRDRRPPRLHYSADA